MSTDILRRLDLANRGYAAVACLATHLLQRAQNADVKPATPKIPDGIP